MKIAMVDPSLFTLPYDEALCLALQRQGHAVTLIGRPPREGEAPPSSEIAHDPLYYAIAGVADRSWEMVRLGVKAADHVVSSARLLRRLAVAKPDIIHFQWTPFPAVDRHVLARLRRLAPLILTVHDTRPFNDKPSSNLQRLGARTIYDSFDRLIVHTRNGHARLRSQGISADRLACIPHGPLIEGTNPATAPLRGGETAINVLLVGKLKPYKGADILIRAVSLLPEPVRARARFLIAGKPYMDVDRLFALAERLGVVPHLDFDLRFLPEDILARYLGRAAILVFPYREIEASGVLFAALRQGRPIIASRLGCFAEMLEDDVHGRLVPPSDPEALAQALEQLIVDRNTRERMGQAVDQLGRSIPSWDDIAGLTSELYGGALQDAWPQAVEERVLRPVA